LPKGAPREIATIYSPSWNSLDKRQKRIWKNLREGFILQCSLWTFLKLFSEKRTQFCRTRTHRKMYCALFIDYTCEYKKKKKKNQLAS
jgi:hypothetical protein